MAEQKLTAFQFDASGVKPMQAFDVLPAGWYPCEISDAFIVATKGKAGGTRANFEFTILAGDYKGRKIFAGLNVRNASAQAQEIAQRELSAICHAVNVINISDLAIFKGKQLNVKIKVKLADEDDKKKGYEDKNEPNGYKPLEGAPLASPAIPPTAPPPPPMPPGAVPMPPAPPVVVAFPPSGWVAHPTATGYFYCGNEIKTEAELRATIAPAPVAPPAPPVPPAPPAPPAPPMPPAPPAVAAFPPVGWQAHPSATGWFYETANVSNMKSEADLRAMASAPAAPAVPAVPPPPTSTAAVPPWQRPA